MTSEPRWKRRKCTAKRPNKKSLRLVSVKLVFAPRAGMHLPAFLGSRTKGDNRHGKRKRASEVEIGSPCESVRLLVAGACNASNALIVPFRIELFRPTA